MSKKEKELQQEPEAAEDAATETAEESQLSEQERLQQKYDELNDQHLRLLAEYDNFRKRTQREKDEIYQNATAATAEKFLAVWDNLERASAFDAGSEEFQKGFALIMSGFGDVLKAMNIEAFGEPGDPFDPALHYAVSHTEDDTLGENVVAQVMQKGYKLGDKVIRYAMVQTAN